MSVDASSRIAIQLQVFTVSKSTTVSAVSISLRQTVQLGKNRSEKEADSRIRMGFWEASSYFPGVNTAVSA